MGEWRPIESAPKDGRSLLVVNAGYPAIMTWRAGGWVYANGHQIELPRMDERKPTHWQPLPALPREEWPTDGTCRRCGSCPRDPKDGLCATCADEHAPSPPIVEPDAHG
jgi:hypothetical protein